MNLFLLLAENADKAAQAADTMPGWAKYVLGPVGALVLLIVYAVYTEKYRMTAIKKVIDDLKDELKEARNDLDTFRDTNSIKKDEIREKAEAREDELEVEIRRLKDKIAKEKSARAWWQAKATGAYKRLEEDLSIPEDIDKTHFGE
jgi:hypothetical protein